MGEFFEGREVSRVSSFEELKKMIGSEVTFAVPLKDFLQTVGTGVISSENLKLFQQLPRLKGRIEKISHRENEVNKDALKISRGIRTDDDHETAWSPTFYIDTSKEEIELWNIQSV